MAEPGKHAEWKNKTRKKGPEQAEAHGHQVDQWPLSGGVDRGREAGRTCWRTVILMVSTTGLWFLPEVMRGFKINHSDGYTYL